jgi:hypothetical protein
MMRRWTASETRVGAFRGGGPTDDQGFDAPAIVAAPPHLSRTSRDTDKLPYSAQSCCARRSPRTKTEGFRTMKREQTMTSTVVPFPAHITPAVADEDTASIIAVLQDQLALAREGRLRSVAVVSVSAEGEAIGTQWSCKSSDISSLIGKLTVLTHDLMAARK